MRRLVKGRMTAALGTLHQGVPFVSMVPFAVAKDGSLILHVSRLASHTQDMLANPDVTLLITESEETGKMPQALARVTVQGRAQVVDRESEKDIGAREIYLTRFPDAAPLFEFADFNIFIVKPVSARIVAGFGQAVTVTGEELGTSLSEIV